MRRSENERNETLLTAMIDPEYEMMSDSMSDYQMSRLPKTCHVRIFPQFGSNSTFYGEYCLRFQDAILSENVLDIRRQWGLHNL